MVVFEETDVEVLKVLETPWTTDTVQQVRTGKIQPKVFGIGPSAIFKKLRHGPVKVDKLGLEGDEHAFATHGGVDKALLQYSTLHYERWKKELPQSAELFVLGGFGENIVATHANERNVCIGDIVQIGEVIAQVSEPRAPCYKLNHRFQVKDMSKRSQDLARTGWLYRILKEGTIQAGDELKLLERPNPEWTVARIQHYLYIDIKNEEMMRQIVQIEELGFESKGIFSRRLNKQYEDFNRRLNGADDAAKAHVWSDYILKEKRTETPRIVSLVFEAKEPVGKPERALPGSHVRLRLVGKLVRAYSVIDGDTNRFQLGVALSETSRGGSSYIHKQLKIGDVVAASRITASFPLAADADHHIFIAGGIGLTAFVASAQLCQKTGQSYHLHYLVRNSHDIALKRYLDQFESNVTIWNKSAGMSFSATQVLGKANSRTHIYCCGSDRLQKAVEETAKSLGVNPNNVHFEQFEVATSGDPFTAELAESGKTLEVDGDKTLLDVLRDAGLDIPSSCEAGNCGTCRVTVKSGRIEHRGTGLPEEEKSSTMLCCVSRGVGKIVLDL